MLVLPTRVSLADLIVETSDAHLISGDPALAVTGVTQDSRRVEPGNLFVAVPG
jgi:UDP-N-acetylmuramyl pentapeptide synthase